MCDVLQIPRSTYYYEAKSNPEEDDIAKDIIRIFKSSRRNYGTRKIKKDLEVEGKVVSRRRIGRIMKENDLVSSYTVAQYKSLRQPTNEEKICNEVNREFDNRNHLEVVVSDLTYVRVAGKWNYVCIILDLHNREIIGYSAGPRKDDLLVYQAFASIKHNLNDI